MIAALFLFLWDFGVQALGGDLNPGDNVLRATLSNGLRVVIVRNPLAPVATTVVNYLWVQMKHRKGFPGPLTLRNI